MQGKRTEALITNIKIPEVDSEVVTRDERLAVRVDRDRVDVIGMGVLVDLSWNGGNDSVLHVHAR